MVFREGTAVLLLEHLIKLTIVQPNTIHIYMAKVFYRLQI